MRVYIWTCLTCVRMLDHHFADPELDDPPRCDQCGAEGTAVPFVPETEAS